MLKVKKSVVPTSLKTSSKIQGHLTLIEVVLYATKEHGDLCVLDHSFDFSSGEFRKHEKQGYKLSKRRKASCKDSSSSFGIHSEP